jgi:hypothetical protein
MKNFLVTGISCLVMLLVINCATGNKYADVKKLLLDYIAATNALEKSLAPGIEGKVVAQALTDYTTIMKELSPKLRELSQKYPELDKTPPADLQDLMTQYKQSADAFTRIFEKLMVYMNDPAVIQAIQDMQTIK